MKKSEIKALKALSLDNIILKISEESRALRSLKFAHAVSPIENPMLIRKKRRLIAVLETELTIKTKAEKR